MNILATTALSVGAIALSASPSTDGRPQEAPIDIHVERSCPASDSCTFSASGAITDEGVVVTESIKAFALAAAPGGDGGVCADVRRGGRPGNPIPVAGRWPVPRSECSSGAGAPTGAVGRS
jgi:hypothetical protein